MANWRIYNGVEKSAPYAGYRGRVIAYPLEQSMAGWAAETLSSGKRLSQLVAERIDLSSGSWTAFLPEDVPSDLAHNPRAGVLPEPPAESWMTAGQAGMDANTAASIAPSLGCSPDELVFVPKYSAVPFLAQWIKTHLQADADAACLLEDAAASASDPSPVPEGLTRWLFGEDVLYAITDGEWDLQRIANAVDNASTAWGQSLILTRLPADIASDPHCRESVDSAAIGIMVGNCDAFALSAYDAESFVMWTRQASE